MPSIGLKRKEVSLRTRLFRFVSVSKTLPGILECSARRCLLGGYAWRMHRAGQRKRLNSAALAWRRRQGTSRVVLSALCFVLRTLRSYVSPFSRLLELLSFSPAEARRRQVEGKAEQQPVRALEQRLEQSRVVVRAQEVPRAARQLDLRPGALRARRRVPQLEVLRVR